MQNNLIIVESPKKAQLIQGFIKSKKLKGYNVMASAGHVRDLKEHSFSVDIKNNYEPIYEVSKDKKALVKELQKAADQADLVWLASDEDREGEAISWHLQQVLSLPKEKTRRIAFHEITSEAFMAALSNPRDINLSLVDAQQARRVLDRIVGFELSPVLWKRIHTGLSAGRVQSVAVRLIVEREREIEAFSSSSSFRIRAIFSLPSKEEIQAELNHRFDNEDDATAFLEKVKTNTFCISSIKTEDGLRNPAPPFTTSTLQQEASRKLGFSVAQTMRVAQSLYESGHITYMRTDSVNLSSLALRTIKSEVIKTYGEEYYQARQYKSTTKGAQEAHEAIRPTYADRNEIDGSLQERKLYDLIRKRAIASQMASAKLERTTIAIAVDGSPYEFNLVGEVIKFKGFLELYMESGDDDDSSDENRISLLPSVEKGQALSLVGMTADERYTKNPARYTEASMVRTMEKLEIGRPSTYATTIQTIQSRGYVEKKSVEGNHREVVILKVTPKTEVKRTVKMEVYGADKNKLIPTHTGKIVNDFLMQQFPSIVDYGFTAKVEDEFDLIAEGKVEWTSLIDRFYTDFHPVVESASIRSNDGLKIGDRILGNDPKTGRQVKATIGRYGPMIQIGTSEDDEKPLFASLQPGQSTDNITLEEALSLFALPKILGSLEGQDVVVGVGRFGAYVRYDGKFTSIPNDIAPLSLTLSDAIELIKSAKEAEAKTLIKAFPSGIEVRNGRYGTYLKYNGANYKLPKKNIDIDSLTEEECKEIIDKSKSTTTKGKSTARKTTKTKASNPRSKKTSSTK